MLANLRSPAGPLAARETSVVREAIVARGRAMLLLGFGAALRRGELVALTLGDVTTVPGRGLKLLVRRSKTDQHAKGQEIAIWANPAEPAFCRPPPSSAGCSTAARRRISTGAAPKRRVPRGRCSALSASGENSAAQASPTRRWSAW
jgi:hypothetical protein